MFEVFIAMKVQIMILLVVTPCSHVDNHLHDYMVSQPRRTQSEVTLFFVLQVLFQQICDRSVENSCTYL
jgi:hypothetical protein